MESKNENVKVPLISKIAYGFGDVGCNFSWMFVSNFLMIFYTDVFGISMAANYILSAGTWIYLCKYPVWHPLWSNDTGYR